MQQPHKDWLPIIIKYIIIGVMAIYILIMMVGLSSCNFTKDVQKTTTDSTTTTKVDSGRVSTNTATNSSTDEWWRETIRMFASKRDTNNTFIYPADEKPAQITIIREGGKSSSQNTVINYDSIWQARQDSTNLATSEKNKQSESEFFSPKVILAIFGGLALLVIIALIFLQYNMNRNFSKIIQIIKT